MRNGSSAHSEAVETAVLSSHSTLRVEKLLSEVRNGVSCGSDEQSWRPDIAIQDGIQEHPTLFIREEMVIIQVQNTRFRIPSFYLTEHSKHFSHIFVERVCNAEILIDEEDVTATGFECLLLLLHPRQYGATPQFDLFQWIDVLHLSDKWGFHNLRIAAIQAIYPLASPVDRISLGLKYGFDDWMTSAFEDLLTRDADLTCEEGHRLGMDMVIKLASGRLRARHMCGLIAQTELRALASELTAKSVPNFVITLHEQQTTQPVKREDHLGKKIDCATPPGPETTQNCIAPVMEVLARQFKNSPGLNQRDALMTVIASTAFLDVSVTRAQRRQYPNGHYYPSFDFHIPDHFIWQVIQTNMSCPEYDICMRTCWLGILGNWDVLSTLAHDWETIYLLGSDSFYFTEFEGPSSQWRTLVIATLYMRHLMDQGIISEDAVSPAAFVDFWQNMTGLADSLEASFMPKLGPRELYRKLRALASLIRLFGSSVITSAAAEAMQDFYNYVEQAQSAAQVTGDRDVVFAYQELIATRPESMAVS